MNKCFEYRYPAFSDCMDIALLCYSLVHTVCVEYTVLRFLCNCNLRMFFLFFLIYIPIILHNSYLRVYIYLYIKTPGVSYPARQEMPGSMRLPWFSEIRFSEHAFQMDFRVRSLRSIWAFLCGWIRSRSDHWGVPGSWSCKKVWIRIQTRD